MTKSVLYIMCGFPYSGKTTVARKISEYTKAKLVSYDEIWMRNKQKGQTPDPNDIADWKETIAAAFEQIRSELRNGNSVIFDHINPKESDRALAAELAKKTGNIRAVVIYVNTPIAIIKKRRVANLKDLARHHIESGNFDKINRLWEEPGTNNNVYEFIPEQDMEQLLKQIG